MYVCGQGVCVPMSNDCQIGVQEDPVILEDVDCRYVYIWGKVWIMVMCMLRIGQWSIHGVSWVWVSLRLVSV